MLKVFLSICILSIGIQSFSQPVISWYWDTIDFESPYEFIEIDTLSQHIWHIGEPDKIFFHESFRGSNAILTDTVNPYPVNADAYFDLHIGAFNNPDFPYNIGIAFKHKFDTDTLRDGGFISVSYDEGATWTNIINDSLFFSPSNYLGPADGETGNLYSESDTLYTGEFGFSGNSGDWISSWFEWFILPVDQVRSGGDQLPDSFTLRFHFVSDSLDNEREGWLIDDILLFSRFIPGGMSEHASIDFSVSPNPFAETTRIDVGYYGEFVLSILDARGSLVRQDRCQNEPSIILNRDGLHPGVYYIQIVTRDQLSGIKKVIVR